MTIFGFISNVPYFLGKLVNALCEDPPEPMKEEAEEIALEAPQHEEHEPELSIDEIVHALIPIISDPEAQELYSKVYGKPIPLPLSIVQQRQEALRSEIAPRVDRFNDKIRAAYSRLKGLEKEWRRVRYEMEEGFGHIHKAKILSDPEVFKTVLKAIWANSLHDLGYELEIPEWREQELKTRHDWMQSAAKVAKVLHEKRSLHGKFYLSMFDIIHIPIELTSLRHIKVLELSRNSLTTLPPQIGDLRYLRVLSLWCNDLVTIPQEIGKLKDLRIIHLSHNHLSSLPPTIGRLQKLWLLNVSHNKLPSLPPELGKLPKLRKLFIAFNYLTTLPEEIRQNRLLRTDAELYLPLESELPTSPELGFQWDPQRRTYLFLTLKPDEQALRAEASSQK